MKKFPVTILDNFYENPDLVRDFALSLEYFPSDGKWPGFRTDAISKINPNFFKIFLNKIFSLFFDLNHTDVSWEVETTFQLVQSFSNDKNDIKNNGWIHSDGDYIFSGVIYLNPNPKEGWGTSIYKIKQNENFNYTDKTKFLHYSNSKDFNEEDYIKEKTLCNSKFIESIRVENVYNRIILFEASEFHGVPSFYSEDNDPRLTQVFFVKKINTPGSFPPAVRSRILYF